MVEHRIRVAEAIAAARQDAGVSQRELAERLGRDRRTIQKWEKGEMKITLEDFLDIFDALNDTGSTIIMITHEQEIAERAKRINYIRDGILSDGRRDGESLA